MDRTEEKLGRLSSRPSTVLFTTRAAYIRFVGAVGFTIIFSRNCCLNSSVFMTSISSSWPWFPSWCTMILALGSFMSKWFVFTKAPQSFLRHLQYIHSFSTLFFWYLKPFLNKTLEPWRSLLQAYSTRMWFLYLDMGSIWCNKYFKYSYILAEKIICEDIMKITQIIVEI